MIAIVPILEQPKTCGECLLCIDKNKYSGTCIINQNQRMPLNSNERAENCKAFFADKAFDTFIEWLEKQR